MLHMLRVCHVHVGSESRARLAAPRASEPHGRRWAGAGWAPPERTWAGIAGRRRAPCSHLPSPCQQLENSVFFFKSFSSMLFAQSCRTPMHCALADTGL